ncbi:MAG: hypothetical protein EB084_23645 [Proteobacteria bacterium]|nr:hypothetical protein [Pseudomonadota bacterium]
MLGGSVLGGLAGLAAGTRLIGTTSPLRISGVVLTTVAGAALGGLFGFYGGATLGALAGTAGGPTGAWVGGLGLGTLGGAFGALGVAIHEVTEKPERYPVTRQTFVARP